MVLAAAMSVQAQAELVVKDESDYVHMTMDELYEEALKEAAEGLEKPVLIRVESENGKRKKNETA